MSELGVPAKSGPAALDRLFRADTVALIGISADPRKLTGAPLRNLLKNGFAGTVYAVNPKYDRMGDVPCYPSIEALPTAPDVALIMLPAPEIPESLRRLGALGTRAAVVISSGFEESEGGAALAEELRRAAQEYGMDVIGPNCEGLWSVKNRLILTFGSAANRDVLHHAPIAIISQSGAIAGGVSRQLQDSGYGCAYVVSVGNETCIDALDVLSWVIEQPDVKVVLLFIEGLRNGARLLDLAARARELGIRLVALKSGNTALGSIAAASHTGKLASPYAIYRDVLRQAGIIQVAGLYELIEAGEILASLPLPAKSDGATPGVAVASIPGGTRALTVDLCDRHGVPLATFTEHTESVLSDLLPGFSYVKNPTDLTGQAVSRPELFIGALQAIASDPNCEAIIVQLANRGPRDLRERRGELAEIVTRRSLPVIVSMLGDVLPAEERRELLSRGIVPARDPVDAVRYLDWLYAARRGGEAHARVAEDKFHAPESGSWQEMASFLDSVGISLPATVVVRCDADIEAAAALPYPLVVKALPEQAEHKTELGLVELGVGSREAMVSAIGRIRARLGDAKAPVLVQESVRGVEAVLSLINDPDFGPVLAIGTGGSRVELWNDMRYLAAPASAESIRRALDELKLGTLLKGFRGSAPSDTAAFESAALRLAQFATQMPANIREIEINPLFVCSQGKGVVAADILVRRRD